jgi:hypothetical protein
MIDQKNGSTYFVSVHLRVSAEEALKVQRQEIDPVWISPSGHGGLNAGRQDEGVPLTANFQGVTKPGLRGPPIIGQEQNIASGARDDQVGPSVS